jgi:hypothetical protein
VVIPDVGGHQGAIELDHVHGQPPQVGDRRGARAEVVDGHRRPGLAQVLQGREHVVDLAHERRLGDLEGEGADGHACPLAGGEEAAGEARVAQLAGGHVHRQAQVRVGGEPAAQLGEGTAQDQFGEGVELAGLLGDGHEADGGDRTAQGVRPPAERFEADGQVRRQVDHRVVDDLELLAGDGRLQLRAQLEALVGRPSHLGPVDPEGAGAGTAGHLQGGVSVAQQPGRRAPLHGEGDPRAGPDEQVTAAGGQGPGNRPQEPARQPAG